MGVDVGEVSLQGRRASTDPTGRIVNRVEPRDFQLPLIDTSIRFFIVEQPNYGATPLGKRTLSLVQRKSVVAGRVYHETGSFVRNAALDLSLNNLPILGYCYRTGQTPRIASIGNV